MLEAGSEKLSAQRRCVLGATPTVAMAAAASEEFQLRAWMVDNVGGFISGSVAIIMGHPFDTIKVRQQAGHVQYASAVECLRVTVRTEGSRALFQGMLAPLLANSAMNAMAFRCVCSSPLLLSCSFQQACACSISH